MKQRHFYVISGRMLHLALRRDFQIGIQLLNPQLARALFLRTAFIKTDILLIWLSSGITCFASRFSGRMDRFSQRSV